MTLLKFLCFVSLLNSIENFEAKNKQTIFCSSPVVGDKKMPKQNDASS